MTGSLEVTHSDPIWRSRSDFIIGASLDDSHGGPGTEQLWARRIGERRFEICCIPFFVYDISLGDIVETDARFLIDKVIRPSGRYVFRVWFGDSAHPRDDVASALKERDALLEWSSTNLVAVDAADDHVAHQIAQFLLECETLGQLTYETGKRN